MNFVEQYATDGGINFGQYSNAEVDKLVEEARFDLANDPEQRRQALIQAEAIMIGQDAYGSALYQAANSYLLAPQVQGFEVLPFGRTINLRTTYITAN